MFLGRCCSSSASSGRYAPWRSLDGPSSSIISPCDTNSLPLLTAAAAHGSDRPTARSGPRCGPCGATGPSLWRSSNHATVVAWHRRAYRAYWRRILRPRGRPRTEAQLRDLIRRMATENRWGAPRIHLLGRGCWRAEAHGGAAGANQLSEPLAEWGCGALGGELSARITRPRHRAKRAAPAAVVARVPRSLPQRPNAPVARQGSGDHPSGVSADFAARRGRLTSPCRRPAPPLRVAGCRLRQIEYWRRTPGVSSRRGGCRGWSCRRSTPGWVRCQPILSCTRAAA